MRVCVCVRVRVCVDLETMRPGTLRGPTDRAVQDTVDAVWTTALLHGPRESGTVTDKRPAEAGRAAI